jgi:hypothetical protein
VVSPFDPQATAERYLARRGGDGGYMLIVQCDDLDGDRRRLDRLGVRTVWKADLPDIRGTHLHPKDTGGTLLSLDDATPPESWRWAGPDWRAHVRRDVVGAIRAAELESDDPRALAARWAEVLGMPTRETAHGRYAIALDEGEIRFVETRDGRGEGLAAFDVEVLDRERLLAAARARGFPAERDHVTVAGVRIGLA